MADVAANWEERSHEGYPYWYNTVTDESVWEEPACLRDDANDVAADPANEVPANWEERDADGVTYW